MKLESLLPQQLINLIKDELNVKDVVWVDNIYDFIDCAVILPDGFKLPDDLYLDKKTILHKKEIRKDS